MRLLVFLLFLSGAICSQNRVKIAVFDASKKEPVPYAVAGNTQKKYSTVSDGNGQFFIDREALSGIDTLRIIALGYKDKNLPVKELLSDGYEKVFLEQQINQLEQVNVKAGKIHKKVVGTKKFNTRNCSAFIGSENNWKGEEAAIRANYTEGAVALIEDFNFYIIRNNYDDSLVFRLMLYRVNDWNMPGKTFLSKPIIFKTVVKNGVVHVDLKDKGIYTDKDFFISLECLMDKMEAEKFCFAGSIETPSFVRSHAFSK